MATDRPDRSGQPDTSRFPLKKVLGEGGARRRALPAGRRSEQQRRGTRQPRAPRRPPAQEAGRGHNPGSRARKVDLDSPRKCSVWLLPEGSQPHLGRTWWTRLNSCGSVATVSANTPQRASSVPPAPCAAAAFQLRDGSCANSPELAL